MIILMPGLSIQGFKALTPYTLNPGAHRNVVAQPGSNVERLAHSICHSIPQGAGPPDGHHHLCSTMYSAWVACSEFTSVQLRSTDASAGPGPEGCAAAHARLEPVVGRGPRPGNTSQGATRKAVPLPHACLDPVEGQMMSSLRYTPGCRMRGMWVKLHAPDIMLPCPARTEQARLCGRSPAWRALPAWARNARQHTSSLPGRGTMQDAYYQHARSAAHQLTWQHCCCYCCTFPYGANSHLLAPPVQSDVVGQLAQQHVVHLQQVAASIPRSSMCMWVHHVHLASPAASVAMGSRWRSPLCIAGHW